MTKLIHVYERYAKDYIVVIAFVILSVCIHHSAQAEVRQTGKVTLNVVYNGSGELLYTVWDKEQYEREMYEDESIIETENTVQSISSGSVRNKVSAGTFTCNIEGLPLGTYMISVFADKNGNGYLDEGIAGPSEPWGMSVLKKKPFLRAPRFDEVSFSVSEGDNLTMEVIVK